MAKFVYFFSFKGGVGVSFLATNTAVALSLSGARVLLIDSSLPIVGDPARLLGLFPARSFLNFYVDHQDLSPDVSLEKLSRYFSEYRLQHNSKLEYIPVILKPGDLPLLERVDPRHLLKRLGELYDFVVVDGGHNLVGFSAKLLDLANLVIDVVLPDLLSVYQSKEMLSTLAGLFLPKELVKGVLNRSASKGGVGLKEIKTILPLDIIAQIPSEGRVVGEALNFGIPVVMYEPNSKVGMAVTRLAELLLKDEDLYVPKRSLSDVEVEEEEVSALVSFWREYGFESDVEKKEQVDEVVSLKKRVHLKLVERMELRKLDFLKIETSARHELRANTERMIGEILAEELGGSLEDYEIRARLVKEIADEALGFGPLEDLLKDPDITDIMVNNKDQIYIEKFGKLQKVEDKKFISNEQVVQIIERIIAPLGRRIDESVPMVDARLPDGSRVNAIIPPLSLNGPMLTIRKFGKERYTAQDLIRFGTLTPEMAEFLKACIIARKNMVISGGTGSGKTTVLNAFSQFIPDHERIVTIEDAAELRLHQEHWVRLESRPPNIEGKGEITIRDLFRNTLRMRPDRIIIGECRSVEALDMLQAMNTGHDGSLTTVHANSPQDVIARLDSMILMSGVELPIRAIREMVASAIDVVVHTARLSDGSRKVMKISELTGLEEDMMTVRMEDVFVFVQTGVDEDGRILGEFTATGYIPSFYDEMLRRGIKLDKSVFTPKDVFYEINKKGG